MARCEVCGNEYDKAFEVKMAGASHTYDSFECAIHALAPTCNHCGCKIIGHGVEDNGSFFCCANCARQAGTTEVRDRV
ncbi:MAG TPA: hypothetical protein VMM84_17400 [Pyrinomonadaceae bacterium]|nr:hypothetical protein [Pyrinomonadaceae bacterium]